MDCLRLELVDYNPFNMVIVRQEKEEERERAMAVDGKGLWGNLIMNYIRDEAPISRYGLPLLRMANE